MAKAKAMIVASMEWRREMRPELIRAVDMGVEARTAKVFVQNALDRHNRPIMCMDGSRENTKKYLYRKTNATTQTTSHRLEFLTL